MGKLWGCGGGFHRMRLFAYIYDILLGIFTIFFYRFLILCYTDWTDWTGHIGII